MSEKNDLLPEYPPELIKGGIRGKHYRQYQNSSNVVVIDPDLSRRFPNSKAVNDALREFLRTHSGE